MRAAFVSAILAVVSCVSPARSAVLEEFQTADWGGVAYSDEATGRLSHCLVFARYENGATLMFSNNADGEWTLGLVHDQWTLIPGRIYPVRYRVDQRADIADAAFAIAGNQIGISFETDDPIIQQLRRGYELTVAFLGADYVFELSNSNRALSSAQECVLRNRDAGPAVAAVEAPSASTEGDERGQVAAADAEQPDAAEDRSSEASIMGEPQAFGPWVVAATDNGAGNFVNCTAFAVYGDDQLIMSYRPDETWEFGIYRADWVLDTEKTYTLWYNVDASVYLPGVVKRPIEAVEPTRIFFEVSELEDFVERMEGGEDLNVQLRGASRFPHRLYYPLERTDEALEATRRCTMGYSRTAQAELTEAGAPAASRNGFPAAPILPPMGETRIEAFDVPGWDAAAYADAGDSFTHCSVSAEYQNGTVLAFARAEDGELVMTLARSDWALAPGRYSPAEYTYEAGPSPIPVETQGVAVSEAAYALVLGRDDRVLRRLNAAPEIAVEAEGQRLRFDISDIGPGLQAIDACVRRHDQPRPEALPRPSVLLPGGDLADPAQPGPRGSGMRPSRLGEGVGEGLSGDGEGPPRQP